MRTENEWDERFGGAVDSPQETTFFNKYDDDDMAIVKEADIHCVWTVIEGDDDKNYLTPGMSIVNAIGYTIAEKPITKAELDSGEWGEIAWGHGDEPELETPMKLGM